MNIDPKSETQKPAFSELRKLVLLKHEIRKQKFYNPYDVFQHTPEYYPSDVEGYAYKIHIVKWNTKSTRMTVLYARFDETKGRWILKRASGLKRMRHGEKMR